MHNEWCSHVLCRQDANDSDFICNHVQRHVLVLHDRRLVIRACSQADRAYSRQHNLIRSPIPLFRPLCITLDNPILEVSIFDQAVVDLMHVKDCGSGCVHLIAELTRPVSFLLLNVPLNVALQCTSKRTHIRVGLMILVRRYRRNRSSAAVVTKA